MDIRNQWNIREHGKEGWATGEDGGSESSVRSGELGLILDMWTCASLSYMRSCVAMLTFLGFLMGLSSSDEEVSSDFLLFLLSLLLSYFLL